MRLHFIVYVVACRNIRGVASLLLASLPSGGLRSLDEILVYFCLFLEVAKILQQLFNGLNDQVAQFVVLQVNLFEAEMIQTVEFVHFSIRLTH